MKIEETTKKLENRSYTTKELIDLGISRYSINKLIDAAILTRTSKGHYDCVLPKIKQSEEASKYFYDFVKNVFKRNYDQAFIELKGNFDTRTVYEYDHHLKIYFTLLSKLTTEKVDLSFLSELQDTNKEITSAEDRIFNEFLKNLYADNIPVAFSYLKSFKEKEETLNGKSTLSTKLFYNLLIAIKIKKRNQNEEKPKEPIVSYGYLIKQFDYYLDNDMYSEALNIIDLIIERAYPKYKDNYLKIKRMLNTYLDLKNNKTILPEIDISYLETNDYSYIFNKALENNDYQTALKNVGKLIYLNPNSKFLKQYRKLLFLINEINKENKKIIEVETPEIKEDKEPKYITSIDSEELYNLVYDAEHEKLYALLDSYFKNPNYESNRIFYTLYQMLKVLKDLSEDRYKPKNSDEIEISEFDSFGYFFEAMRKKNYWAAYNVVDACDKKNKERNNNNEFELYKYMLQDVIKELNRYEENKILMEKIKEFDSVIDTYIYHKGTYTKDEVKYFLKILEDKKTYMIDNYIDLSDDEEKLLSLLKTIISFDSFYGEFSEYFDHKEYKGSLVEQFNASMEYGDYSSSLEIITNQDWIAKTCNLPNRKYFEAYKKLLFTLKNSTELPLVKKESIEVTEFSEPEGILVLRKIKSFVKKNDYASAFITYVDSNLDETNPELHIYLDVILKGLVKYQESESIILLQQYKNAFNSGDIIKARTYLDAYKKCISKTGLDRELDYHYNRIDDLQNRINDDNFVLLQNLFDEAKYYYKQQDYQNCIAKATEFIKQDNDRTARGYLLRGRAYECLRDFKQAESDYEKAVSISKEPNALFRLGRLAMYRSEYDGALAYLNQVGQRRNVFNIKLTQFLKETYEGLNDSENAKKYQKRLKVFSKES